RGVVALSCRYPLIYRPDVTVGIDQESVEDCLYRALCRFRAGIAHVIVLESGLHNRNPCVLALLFARNDIWISFELRVFGAERQDLELSLGQERNAEIVQRHDLL